MESSTPKFSAVMNTNGDPEGLVRRGNERVLRARFNDGRFFWETDQRKKLADRVARSGACHVSGQAGHLSGEDRTGRRVGQGTWRGCRALFVPRIS